MRGSCRAFPGLGLSGRVAGAPVHPTRRPLAEADRGSGNRNPVGNASSSKACTIPAPPRRVNGENPRPRQAASRIGRNFGKEEPSEEPSEDGALGGGVGRHRPPATRHGPVNGSPGREDEAGRLRGRRVGRIGGGALGPGRGPPRRAGALSGAPSGLLFSTLRRRGFGESLGAPGGRGRGVVGHLVQGAAYDIGAVEPPAEFGHPAPRAAERPVPTVLGVGRVERPVAVTASLTHGRSGLLRAGATVLLGAGGAGGAVGLAGGLAVPPAISAPPVPRSRRTLRRPHFGHVRTGAAVIDWNRSKV